MSNQTNDDRDDTPEDRALDALIILAFADTTAEERRRLFEDGISIEEQRAEKDRELERIFGPGWKDDVRRTIDRIDAAVPWN